MKASVNWMEGWANPPKLEIHLDRYPESGQFVYEETQGCYFAVDQETGVVRYFYYERPGRGYGGRTFDLKMKDGSTRSLIGPWSSRCQCMNEVGFPHSVECVIITEDGCNYAGALLIDVAKEYLRAAEGDAAEFVFDSKENEYTIQRIQP